MKYISFLRGINVGGRRPLPMIELKKMLSGLGMKNISTYIQSGNVIYHCENNDQLVISKQIEDEIKKVYGYDVPVITLSINEFLQKIELNPYLSDTDTSRLHVSFLERIPTQENISTLYEIDVKPESFSLNKDIIFIRCKNKFASQSKLTNTFFESKLKVKTTSRNWKTVTKIKELVKQID